MYVNVPASSLEKFLCAWCHCVWQAFLLWILEAVYAWTRLACMENQVDADRLHSFLVDHGSVYMTTVVLEIIVYVFFMCCHDISRFFPALPRCFVWLWQSQWCELLSCHSRGEQFAFLLHFLHKIGAVHLISSRLTVAINFALNPYMYMQVSLKFLTPWSTL